MLKTISIRKIYNIFNNNYHNAYNEGNNNFIRVLKRIAFWGIIVFILK